jgi:glutaconate CoA-transferase, subunit A
MSAEVEVRDDERRSVVTDIGTAADAVSDGMTVAIGGFINTGHPMAIVRELIRREMRDLRVVGAASAGLEVDLLIAAGCVATVVTPYVGAEGLASIGPAFRRCAQEGAIEVFEIDEAQFYAGLRASAQRLPFHPWKAGVGTSIPEVNPAIREFRDPLTNELLLAVPALEIDVCFLHVDASDQYGNVQHLGQRWGDVAMYQAASKTFVQVERLISNEQVRARPELTSIPGADGVIRVPFGAHPFSALGSYPVDKEGVEEYVRAAEDWMRTGSRDAIEGYLQRYVTGPQDHYDYLETVGIRRLLGLSEY